MLEEVNHELFTLCEDAATDFLHPLLEQLHAAYVKTPKAEWPALEEKIIVSTIDKLTNAEKFNKKGKGVEATAG